MPLSIHLSCNKEVASNLLTWFIFIYALRWGCIVCIIPTLTHIQRVSRVWIFSPRLNSRSELISISLISLSFLCIQRHCLIHQSCNIHNLYEISSHSASKLFMLKVDRVNSEVNEIHLRLHYRQTNNFIKFDCRNFERISEKMVTYNQNVKFFSTFFTIHRESNEL